MPYWYRPIVNSDLIGERITIQLPGFPGGKAEKCLIHYITLGDRIKHDRIYLFGWNE